jgi:hypothetical protein
LVDSAVCIWEGAEEYYRTYHNSVVVCSSPTVIAQVKALYPAAVELINWETDVARILNRLKMHSKASVSDNLAESIVFRLNWSHNKKNDFNNADNMKRKVLDSFKYIEECVVNNCESVFITLLSQVYKKWLAVFDNHVTQEAIDTRKWLKSGVFEFGESRTMTVNVLVTQIIGGAKHIQDLQVQALHFTPEQKQLRR